MKIEYKEKPRKPKKVLKIKLSEKDLETIRDFNYEFHDGIGFGEHKIKIQCDNFETFRLLVMLIQRLNEPENYIDGD